MTCQLGVQWQLQQDQQCVQQDQQCVQQKN
jgi:hypothetical protein